MNIIETNEIIKSIIFAYPRTYEKYFNNNLFKYDDLIKLWQEQFKNETYYLVNRALKNLISENKFAPTIADIKAEIGNLKNYARVLKKRHINATKGVEVEDYDILTNKVEKKYITDGTPLTENELEEVKKILGD